MPTYWESSKRPLFVKTVLINGSRHAILTQEDPLVQQLSNNTKTSRPNSAGSSDSGRSSTSSGRISSEDNKEKGAKKGPRDLQACIVKLQMVLGKHDNRKMMTSAKTLENDSGHKKRRRTLRDRNLNLEPQELQRDITETEESPDKPTNQNNYDNNQNLAIASFFMNETNNSCCCKGHGRKDTERIVGRFEEPQTQETPLQVLPMDLPWSAVSTESYFIRPFYNRLSERVLQWLDLSNKNKPKPEAIPMQPPAPRQERTKTPRKPIVHQESSEDNSDEVRVEEDVDTVLSTELPKFSQELNRLHNLKSAIPEKPDAYTTQLHQSITESFSSVVGIRSGKYAEIPKTPILRTSKHRQPIRQARIEESSDEDPPPSLTETNIDQTIKWGTYSFLERINSNDKFTRRISYQAKVRVPWLREKWPPETDIGKPQLHIFIPALPKETEQWSDSASVNSD